jgi:predicted permease
MSWKDFVLRLRALFLRRRMDEELQEELQFHLEMQARKNGRREPDPAMAKRQAHLQFGSLVRATEDCRQVRGISSVEILAKDLRFALRMFTKSPGFTAVAVLTLALGIGANTAIFSLVDCLVLRPIPMERPGEVVFLAAARNGSGLHTAFSYPDFTEIQKQTGDIFSSVSAAEASVVDGLAVDGKSQPMLPSYVTGDFFGLLGFKPALGRFVLPSEGSVAGADPVLVLSYAYWKSRFNGDPSVIGEKASVNGVPVTIVGVAPEGFHGISSLVDFQGYMPLGMGSALKDFPKDFLVARENAQFVAVIARLKAGVSLEQAQVALNVVARRLSQQSPTADRGMTLSAFHLGPIGLLTDPANLGLFPLVSALFLILAGAVLVLACMNIANLFLVRAATRQREMALRAALGAPRTRLIRQLFTESLLLALLGCIAGIILGLGGSRAFGSIPLHTSLPIVLDFRFDWRVLAYAIGAAILTALLVGIVPALRASRCNLNEILHEGGRTSTAGGYRVRCTLAAAQVGGSLMLLIIAGLFVRSLEKAQHTDLGFDPNHVLNLTIDPHEAGYDEPQTRAFFRMLLDRAPALPGIQSASLAASVPMAYGGGAGATLKIDGYQPPKDQENPSADYNAVTPGYFQTMHISLLRGREIQDSDSQNSQRVAVIDQAMADRYWRGQDPIGRHFSTTDDPAHPVEVVGIARNALDEELFTPDLPFFYVPFSQFYQPSATLQLRSAAAPEALAPEVTRLIRSIEPAMPVFDVQP